MIVALDYLADSSVNIINSILINGPEFKAGTYYQSVGKQLQLVSPTVVQVVVLNPRSAPEVRPSEICC